MLGKEEGTQIQVYIECYENKLRGKCPEDAEGIGRQRRMQLMEDVFRLETLSSRVVRVIYTFWKDGKQVDSNINTFLSILFLFIYRSNDEHFGYQKSSIMDICVVLFQLTR